MSALSEAQYGRAAIREGAKGYHGKSGNLEELARAVRIVLAGRRYVSAALAEIMASDLDSKLDPHRPQHEREKMSFTSNADITAYAIRQDMIVAQKIVVPVRYAPA